MATRQYRGGAASAKGNFVSEWFNYRIYPEVIDSSNALANQRARRCTMLSMATKVERVCIKNENAKGICSINSASNERRQDWLVCPYRALDPVLLNDAARRFFNVPVHGALKLLAAPAIEQPEIRQEFVQAAEGGATTVLFLQSKLGGEISVSATDRSPEMAFDITMVEVSWESGAPELRRYGILEIQTMDFHGTYKHAVRNLSDALRLHTRSFAREIARNQHWLSDHVEGPNIANVFKRTFYQMLFKFQIGAHPHSAGCIFAIPESVWDSWQRHLGKPDLVSWGHGDFALAANEKPIDRDHTPGWIYVFDLDATTGATPNPVRILKRIATNAASLAHYAVEVAPSAAIEAATPLTASWQRSAAASPNGGPSSLARPRQQTSPITCWGKNSPAYGYSFVRLDDPLSVVCRTACTTSPRPGGLRCSGTCVHRHRLAVDGELFTDLVSDDGDVIAEHTHLQVVVELELVNRVTRIVHHGRERLPFEAADPLCPGDDHREIREVERGVYVFVLDGLPIFLLQLHEVSFVRRRCHGLLPDRRRCMTSASFPWYG